MHELRSGVVGWGCCRLVNVTKAKPAETAVFAVPPAVAVFRTRPEGDTQLKLSFHLAVIHQVCAHPCPHRCRLPGAEQEPYVRAQNGSLMMCTSHPKKGDLTEFNGRSAEEEETHEQACRAQLGAVLHHNTERHICFSKQLLTLADADFVASPPPTPRRRKKTGGRRPQVPQQAAPEDEPAETRNLEDLAAFFSPDSEEEDQNSEC